MKLWSTKSLKNIYKVSVLTHINQESDTNEFSKMLCNTIIKEKMWNHRLIMINGIFF